MIRSKDMLKASVIALNSDKDKIMAKLHEMGVMQLSDLKMAPLAGILTHSRSSDSAHEISDYMLRVSRLRTILDIVPAKRSFTENTLDLAFLDKESVERKETKKILKEAEQFLKQNEDDLIELEENYMRHTSNIEVLEEEKKTVRIFKDSGIAVENVFDTKRIFVISGIMPSRDVEKLKADVKEISEGYCVVSSSQKDKESSLVIVASLKEYIDIVTSSVKKYNLSIIQVPQLREGKKDFSYIEKDIEASKSEIEVIKSKLKEIRKKLYRDVIILRETLHIEEERNLAYHNLVESKNFFVVEGWIEKDKKKLLEKEIKELTKERFMIEFREPAKDEENVPVEPTNPRWLKPFEMLTELYALPKYKDLDPTFVVGPLFLIYAGFMLTDFVYGAGLLALGLFISWKFSKYDKNMKYVAINITWMGIFAMIFGVLTGSYLGDAPNYFFGVPTAKLAIWKDPLADPLYFLIISIVVALIHLNIGLILGAVEDFRNKDYKAFVKERLVWFMLQTSIAFMYFKWSPLFGKILLAATVLLVIIMSGPLGVLGMTGFMGDVISYSRLFALALSTAGIAMTVNLLMNLVKGVPYVGIIAAILIFVGGHIFSFLMNSLGSFVHSIRLQFVEFFGKFYEGGGDRFSPFTEKRVYTKVEAGKK